MKFITTILVALAATVCMAQTPTSTFSVRVAGKDSLNRDSIWLVETVYLPTETGYTQNQSARLIMGKSEARNYLRALQDDLIAQKAKIDEAKAKRDKLEADVVALRQALNNAQAPAPRAAPGAPTLPATETTTEKPVKSKRKKKKE